MQQSKPRQKEKKVSVNFRMRRDLVEKVSAEALKTGLTKTRVFENALEKQLP